MRLTCQELSLSAEQINEIIGHRPHTRNFRKVAADQEPHVALGQAFSKGKPNEAWLTGRDVSWQKRDAEA